MDRDDLTDVPGFRAGSAEDPGACTGCTVVLCPPEGAVGGVEQRGGAPGTRETDPLRPLHLVDRCHAVLLTGGSAFGLDAAGGVVRYLERRGIGFFTRAARVPIVPAAVLYDLALGRADVRPDSSMGEAACAEAERGERIRQGNAGAGCGASVGKVNGLEWAIKGGVGSASEQAAPGIFVGALAAVNVFGDVVDPAGGMIVAGARVPGSRTAPFEFADTVKVLRTMHAERLGFGRPDRAGGESGARGSGGARAGEAVGRRAEGARDEDARRRSAEGTNTVIAVVATNARLDKEGANILAGMAMSGFSLALRPCHTTVDGDTLFALAAGEMNCDVNLLGAVAAEVTARAIVNAVLRAGPLGGLPAVGAPRV